MQVFGLIGYPLQHSFSAEFFTAKFRDEKIQDVSYDLMELRNIQELPSLIAKTQKLRGLNVTIPYKQAVIPFLDSLDPLAASIGAVNCIDIRRDGDGFQTIGYNTDATGFRKSLVPFLAPHHKRALILGTGGSSKTVAHVLRSLGIGCLFVSRNPDRNGEVGYQELDKGLLKSHTLIINTSPVGMFPDIADSPHIPYDRLTPRHLLFDLIYNPAETQFLRLGREAGATVKNGLEMLQLQAMESWRIWNNRGE